MTAPIVGGFIIVAEDDPFDRRILAQTLESAGHTVKLVANGEEAWRMVNEEPPEILLTDWMMPKLEGYELCARIKAEPRLKAVFCILLTAKGGIDEKVAALDIGADDYLIKPCDDDELLARVRTGLRVHRLCVRLEEISVTDALTGLRNCRYLDQRLEEEVSRGRRYQSALSLVLIDLDGFASINDRFGRSVGDEILAVVGKILHEQTRLGEVVARIGGDEFAVLLPNTNLTGAEAFSRRIESALATVAKRIPDADKDLQVSTSVGAAELTAGRSAADLMTAARSAVMTGMTGTPVDLHNR